MKPPSENLRTNKLPKLPTSKIIDGRRPAVVTLIEHVAKLVNLKLVLQPSSQRSRATAEYHDLGTASLVMAYCLQN